MLCLCLESAARRLCKTSDSMLLVLYYMSHPFAFQKLYPFPSITESILGCLWVQLFITTFDFQCGRYSLAPLNTHAHTHTVKKLRDKRIQKESSVENCRLSALLKGTLIVRNGEKAKPLSFSSQLRFSLQLPFIQ